MKTKSKHGNGFDLYYIKSLNRESCFSDFSPLFIVTGEKVSFDIIYSVREFKQDFSEEFLKAAKSITKEKFEEAKQIIETYNKKLKNYAKTIQ